jgi:hypothetical protein
MRLEHFALLAIASCNSVASQAPADAAASDADAAANDDAAIPVCGAHGKGVCVTADESCLQASDGTCPFTDQSCCLLLPGADGGADAGVDSGVPVCGMNGRGSCIAANAPCNEASEWTCQFAGDVCCFIVPGADGG